ncbi:cysteine proteinase inhibitor 5-like [Salvia divinorum]|uniref:Cysteine proteinase inhibitor 5-like n=1 Tax=Salvia divinorum TaxID=28513 RepID=A0ABD1FZJ6_SALDI
MTPKSLHILFASLSILAVALPISAALDSPLVGGWSTIADPNTPQIVEIAKFAVSEHNKQAKTPLVFVSVVKGESQVVAGLNYRLEISVNDGGGADSGTYSAVVYSKIAPKLLELTSFDQIEG